MAASDCAPRNALDRAELRALRLVLSRIVGEVRGRHVSTQICRLVGEAFAVPGPWPDEEFSLHRIGCDWEQIAARWTVAAAKGEPLPDDVLRAFFPGRLWPSLWQLIALGPAGATRTIEATLQAVGHGLTVDGEPRPTGALSAITIDGLSIAFGRFVRAVIELHKQSLDTTLGLKLPTSFQPWSKDVLPRRRSAFELGARLRRRNNTSAVPLRLVRLALQTLNSHIERNGARPSYKLGLHLRNRVLIGLLALGPRIGTVVKLQVRDYDPAHEFPDGTIGPAIRFRWLKSLPGIYRWRGIPPLLARWIEEYFEYYRIAAEVAAPFWVTKRAGLRQMEMPTVATLTAAVVSTIARIQPRDDFRKYRPHSLRHLAEQVCFAAAIEYLGEHRRDLLHDEGGRGLPANPQVLCDCLLDHALHDISDRYKDVNNEQGREVWGRFAALLVWEYVWSEKGARPIPDIGRIRVAREALKEQVGGERALEARIRELEERRDQMQRKADHRLDEVLRGLAELDDAARWRAHFEHLAAMRQIAQIDKEINGEALSLVELTRTIERSRAALAAARKARIAAPDELSDHDLAELRHLLDDVASAADVAHGLHACPVRTSSKH